jgi:hypothetical protein
MPHYDSDINRFLYNSICLNRVQSLAKIICSHKFYPLQMFVVFVEHIVHILNVIESLKFIPVSVPFLISRCVMEFVNKLYSIEGHNLRLIFTHTHRILQVGHFCFSTDPLEWLLALSCVYHVPVRLNSANCVTWPSLTRWRDATHPARRRPRP